MITFQEAVETIMSLSTAWGTEFVPLEEAPGRTLAETIKADRDYPPFDRAAMDGFAVLSEDILDKKITRFHVVGELFAGSNDQFTVRSGEALKIMTGAPVPRTADAVIKKEDVVEEESGTVTFRTSEFERRQCIAEKGEDIRSGDTVFSHGIQITPGCLSVLASLGKKNVCVAKLPAIALISTGNEIRSVEDPVASYQIRDANRYSIEGFLFNYSIRPSSAAIVRDEIDALT
jgi:molybdopterin molybdotransferase